jgi:hypothetical protein
MTEWLRLLRKDYVLLWDMLFSCQQLKFISLKLTLAHEPQGKQTSLFRDARVISRAAEQYFEKPHSNYTQWFIYMDDTSVRGEGWISCGWGCI